MSAEQIYDTHKQSLKKKSVEKLEIVKNINKESYSLKHVLACSVFTVGFMVLPGPFKLINFGYLTLYQLHFFNRLTQFRFGKTLPFAYNFDSVHFFYCLGASLFIIWGMGLKMAIKAHEMKGMKQNKNLVVQKGEEVAKKHEGPDN